MRVYNAVTCFLVLTSIGVQILIKVLFCSKPDRPTSQYLSQPLQQQQQPRNDNNLSQQQQPASSSSPATSSASNTPVTSSSQNRLSSSNAVEGRRSNDGASRSERRNRRHRTREARSANERSNRQQNGASQPHSNSNNARNTSLTERAAVLSNGTPSPASNSRLIGDVMKDVPLPKYRRDLVHKMKTLRNELQLLQPQTGHCRLEVSREEVFEVCFRFRFFLESSRSTKSYESLLFCRIRIGK